MKIKETDPNSTEGETLNVIHPRPCIKGKFIYNGEQKLFVRGVTYGTFCPREDGVQFPQPEIVESDFAFMHKNNINCVRIYTLPPQWLLDCAQRYGLWFIIGIPWEQHITFLDDKKRIEGIERLFHKAVRDLNQHPVILMYAIGNEIPPMIVRWYGRHRIEKFLKRLYEIVKQEDPKGLVTYANYPTTEYLQLNFLDVLCFNVYLEKKEIFEVYLARLQNIADGKPVILTEIGLDSQRNGELVQADFLDWQVRSVFAAGFAGAVIFSWTDEWYRGGFDIKDWDFGLTTRDRQPKAALSITKSNFAQTPFPSRHSWPRVSVFVCSYNGSRTIRKTLSVLENIDYPNYEIVVVDDGSKDNLAQIAGEYKVRLISTEKNRGLAMARNEALQDEAAEIIAYIDDDAYPDLQWLKYLVYIFLTTDYVAVGGPNLLPLDSGFIANCVDNAPGGPMHVLIGNTEAEHIPGCNMAFKKEALKAIGGFDPQFCIAGDDVDVCWRLQEMGWKIGFHPSAIVWHNRRDSIRNYLKQQYNYGKAEAKLEHKWPCKYNSIGHISWGGRIYGHGITIPLFSRRWRVYYGTQGRALFQSIYQPAYGFWSILPLMPEWYLLIAFLAIITFAGISWYPLFCTASLLTFAVLVSVIQAIRSANRSVYAFKNISFFMRMRLNTITALLHLLQPLIRLIGRISFGLHPWKSHGIKKFILPRRRIVSFWTEKWRPAHGWLDIIAANLKDMNLPIIRGGDFDQWDFEVRGGFLGGTRLLMTIEEHGQGKQMLRFRLTPNFKIRRTWVIGVFLVLALMAGLNQSWFATVILGCMAALFTISMFLKCVYSKKAIIEALARLDAEEC